MGNQQPSLEQRKVQRLSLYGSRIASDWQFETIEYLFFYLIKKGGLCVSTKSKNKTKMEWKQY